MVAIAAGRKIRASELNDAIPLFARSTADLTKTSSAALADVTGLAIAMTASTVYALDGYIAYDSGPTGDLKLALAAPTGTTGHWALHGIATTATGSIGDLDVRRVNGFGDSNTRTLGGYDADPGLGTLMGTLRGYVVVASTAGNLQVRFAQNTSNATSSVLKAGSWIRLTKIA